MSFSSSSWGGFFLGLGGVGVGKIVLINPQLKLLLNLHFVIGCLCCACV